MAFAGNKTDRSIELETITQRNWVTAVDAFYGAGGLTHAFNQSHTARYSIAGEIFAPLRELYHAKINYAELCDRVLADIDELGETAFWAVARSALDYQSFRYTPAEAFVILNNLSYGNGMRHGKGSDGVWRHNTKLAEEKLRQRRDKKYFIDPIVLRPTGQIFGNWRSALMAASGRDAIALLDPPYLKAASIYPDENPTLCACPPVELAMQRGYGAIVAYNSNCLDLDFMFNRLADRYLYSIEMQITKWRTRYCAYSQTKQGTEAMWVFRRREL